MFGESAQKASHAGKKAKRKRIPERAPQRRLAVARNHADRALHQLAVLEPQQAADLATLAFKNSVLGPLANWLSKGLGGIFAPVKHAGGMVGGPGPGRMVPALAFAGAPRMHSGGWAGLRPDEVPAILQRGERVLSRAELAAGMSRGGAGGVSISIDARGAQAGVAEQIDAKLRAAIPEIARLAKASVADGRRRGHAL